MDVSPQDSNYSGGMMNEGRDKKSDEDQEGNAACGSQSSSAAMELLEKLQKWPLHGSAGSLRGESLWGRTVGVRLH